MAASMDTLIEEISAGFIAERGQDLAGIIEGMPDFGEALTAGLHELGEWIAAEMGDEETGAKISDMAVHAGALEEAAKEAAQSFAQRNKFWLENRL